MKVKILQAGPYSNPKDPRKPLVLNVGDTVDFSDSYAEGLDKSGLVEPYKSPIEKFVDTVQEKVVGKKILASQSVKNLAEANGIDLAGVIGTGAKGRIKISDVEVKL